MHVLENTRAGISPSHSPTLEASAPTTAGSVAAQEWLADYAVVDGDGGVDDPASRVLQGASFIYYLRPFVKFNAN